ncbi:uncharacterized protein PAC_06919 [Phialocephala subalpina]|uniref:RING-type domain-containing protein n=1 Tax=Phialocephala subalpina TaxID=576137 RepID=A0A1L7WW93_9HELO|nr:uncharacterized protein PAC_06919 [Phialocephala subalpina]
MSSAEPNWRSTSPPRCSICQEYRSEDLARLLPCGHEFDLTCVNALLRSSGVVGRSCPLCRSRIQEVHHYFKPDGTYETHIVGPARAESPLISGPFIREDEELREGMSFAERESVLEFRRLRQGEDYHLRMCLLKGQNCAREGNKIIFTRSCIDIEIDQLPHLAGTTSVLRRKLLIPTTPITPAIERAIRQAGAPDTNAITRARKETGILLAKIGDFRQQYTTFDLKGLRYKVQYDAKGLNTSVRKSVRVRKEEDGDAVVIVRTVELSEMYATRPPETDPDESNGIYRVDREKAIRLAREEIQGVLEFAFVKVPGFRPLEPVSSGILDVRVGRECEYCDLGGHRNGDCELMLVREILTDMEFPEGLGGAGAV